MHGVTSTALQQWGHVSIDTFNYFSDINTHGARRKHIASTESGGKGRSSSSLIIWRGAQSDFQLSHPNSGILERLTLDAVLPIGEHKRPVEKSIMRDEMRSPLTQCSHSRAWNEVLYTACQALIVQHCASASAFALYFKACSRSTYRFQVSDCRLICVHIVHVKWSLKKSCDSEVNVP